MARYRKIDVRIWNDEKFRSLSDRGKLAFFFLLTHPHLTSLGAMRATVSGLAEELHWTVDVMRDAMRHAMSLGLIELDEKACYVGLKNFLRYNEPEGPNSVVKGWLNALEMLPECSLKASLIYRCRKYLDGKSDAFKEAMPQAIWDAFSDAIAQPCPIQEQEQEQDIKRDFSPRNDLPTPSVDSLPAITPAKSQNGHTPDVWKQIVALCKKTIPTEAMGEFGMKDVDYWFDRPEQVSFAGGVLRVETKHDTVTEPRGLGKYAQWIREARTKFGVNKIEFLLDGVPKDIRVKPRT
jgi:hypothetical protein